MRFIRLKLIAALQIAVLAFALTSCEEPKGNTNQPPADADDAASTSGTIKFEGEIISIPSPVQVVNLIQKSNIPFSEALISPLSARERFVSESKKALNMGIYGADLAYVANYNQGQTCNDYLDAVAKLAGDLGVLEKIDKGLVSKLSGSINEKDSLIKLNADLFKAVDMYLKGNQQGHISSYVLIGGWIESLHLASDAAKTNEALRMRLGEQKYAAESILKLGARIEDQAFDPIKSAIEDLCETLKELESTYAYRQPINDHKTKTTYLRSQTTVKVTDEQLATLTEQISKVRNLITE